MQLSNVIKNKKNRSTSTKKFHVSFYLVSIEYIPHQKKKSNTINRNTNPIKPLRINLCIYFVSVFQKVRQFCNLYDVNRIFYTCISLNKNFEIYIKATIYMIKNINKTSITFLVLSLQIVKNFPGCKTVKSFISSNFSAKFIKNINVKVSIGDQDLKQGFRQGSESAMEKIFNFINENQFLNRCKLGLLLTPQFEGVFLNLRYYKLQNVNMPLLTSFSIIFITNIPN
eukprot:TRINITY_DN4450_c0_g3_i1.p3 TRINITY_DN4450_c0_g3~~TRINITY_DN4450_c0_g3_i1.p3  ORF type:complete len:227 (-),score=-7.39 TRINITY_DN4450_c0_g3_i1:295-975(-)